LSSPFELSGALIKPATKVIFLKSRLWTTDNLWGNTINETLRDGRLRASGSQYKNIGPLKGEASLDYGGNLAEGEKI
jgi:hypothetical protein